MCKTILFISHDATRTGAPIMFLHFINWIKEHTGTNIIILLKKGGPMVDEFKKIGPTYIYFDKNTSSSSNRLINSYRSRKHNFNILKTLKRASIDLVYANTITNGNLYHVIRELSVPVITHVHELERVIKNFAANNLDYIKKYTTHYIAASKAVKDNLILNHDIDGGKVSIFHEFIPTAKFSEQGYGNKPDVLSELGIQGPDPFIVGGAGRFDLRKGADIFLHVMKRVCGYGLDRQIYFMWVGAKNSGDLYNWLTDDAQKAALGENLKIIPPTDDPRKYYSVMNVFLMTSREDPFPLVCLESAAMGVPVICFEGGGGMPEFVEQDAGAVVPYFDVDKMAGTVRRLVEEPGLWHKWSSAAAEKVSQRHDVNTVAPRLFKKIEEILANANKS